MRALVLGAAGHLGNATVRELLAHGHQVTAAVRRNAAPLNLKGLAVRRVRGDADRPGQVRRWLPGHDLVVDAAAPYPLHLFYEPPGVPSPLALAEERTRRLLDAVADHGARLAYIGSFVTRPRRLSRGETRADRLARRHPYFAVKERIESLVLAAARQGLPAVIVNPQSCQGPWDSKPRHLCLLPQLLRGDVAALVQHVINVVDVREVAAVLVSAVERGRFGMAIPVCGHNVRLEELAARLAVAGGVPPPLWRPPLRLGLAASWWTEALFALAGRPSPWPTLSLMLVAASRETTPGAVQLELGAAPRPLAETLGDALAWYRRIGYC